MVISKRTTPESWQYEPCREPLAQAPRPGELLFAFQTSHRVIACELLYSRRFDTREQAAVGFS